MWLFKQSLSAARTALFYITVGALTVIWTGVWYVYLFNNRPDTSNAYYWCTGFLVTGLTLVTRNTADVARTGVRLLNPFDPR